MRKLLLTIGAVGTATLAIGAGTALGATAVVTVDGQMTGKETPKLDKKKFKPTSITVSTTTLDADNPAGLPPKPTQAVITYDKKNVRFNSDAAPTCEPSQIAGTTTEGAIDACGDAQVGTGRSVASLPFGVGGTREDHPATVTAFNRGDTEGILLHARADDLGTTTLLAADPRKGLHPHRDRAADRRRDRLEHRVQHHGAGEGLRPGALQGQEDRLPGRVQLLGRRAGVRHRRPGLQAEEAEAEPIVSGMRGGAG